MRARNIKPGLFKNEELAECTITARYLFTGLWCMADREGRLEDRPKRIKAELLPYDRCNIDELLNALQPHSILRYSVNGSRYIQVVNFKKHQNPHVNERPSEIPAPDNSGASTVQVPKDSASNPSDSLIPSSLIPDSHDSPNKTAPSGADYPPEFSTFWEQYPRMREKKKAFKNWNTLLKAGVDPQTLIRCAHNYASECEVNKTELKYIKLPATFLGPSRPYEDYVNATVVTGETTCVTCDHWEKGWCEERKEKTPSDNYCKKWKLRVEGKL